MSYDFKKLSDVTAVTEIEDGDYILTVKNGEVKKIKKSDAKFGGGALVLTEENCICYWDGDGSCSYYIVADELESTLMEVAKNGEQIIWLQNDEPAEDGYISWPIYQSETYYAQYNDDGDVCVIIRCCLMDGTCGLVQVANGSTTSAITGCNGFVLPKKLADYWEIPYEDGD